MKFLMLISIKVSRNSAFPDSAKPRMLIVLLINVKMQTIVGTFNSFEQEKILWHFNIYEQEKFHAQLSGA